MRQWCLHGRGREGGREAGREGEREGGREGCRMRYSLSLNTLYMNAVNLQSRDSGHTGLSSEVL